MAMRRPPRGGQYRQSVEEPYYDNPTHIPNQQWFPGMHPPVNVSHGGNTYNSHSGQHVRRHHLLDQPQPMPPPPDRERRRSSSWNQNSNDGRNAGRARHMMEEQFVDRMSDFRGHPRQHMMESHSQTQPQHMPPPGRERRRASWNPRTNHDRGGGRGTHFGAAGARHQPWDNTAPPPQDQFRNHRGKRPRDRGGGNPGEERQSFDERELKLRLGYRRLQELSEEDPSKIIAYLANDRNGYKDLLQQIDSKDDRIFFLASIFDKICRYELHKKSVQHIVVLSSDARFLTILQEFTFNLMLVEVDRTRYMQDRDREKKEKIPQFLAHLQTFYEFIMQNLPQTACERLQNNVNACCTIIVAAPLTLNVSLPIELTSAFEALKRRLDKAVEEIPSRSSSSYIERLKHLKPPDDFRSLSVVPTLEDLLSTKKPFLRPNIVDGAYTDAEHYLDVHFRLVREDFFAPLREGIQEYLTLFGSGKVDAKGKRKRINNVRVYENVQWKESKLVKDDIVHTIVLDMKKFGKIHWENSKRLIYGSLLCLTKDMFGSVLIALVVNREEIKNGKIGIKLESTTAKRDCLQGTFTMIEAEVYFEACRPVLEALKNTTENNFPMHEYIVLASKAVALPSYLARQNTEPLYNLSSVVSNARLNDHTVGYDLERLLQKKRKKEEKDKVKYIFDSEDENEQVEETLHVPVDPVLRNVALNYSHSWPTPHQMHLDPSQHSALMSALTQKFVVIQGPPGTGKTFLGLKIVQVLLHNSHVWKQVLRPAPILVVCYTNHALDQFLEGILRFTRSVVRIGSRSKNEIVAKYNMVELRRKLTQGRLRSADIYQHERDIYNEASSIREEYEATRRTVDLTKGMHGIIHEELFLMNGILTKEQERYLTSYPVPEKYSGNLMEFWLSLNIENYYSSDWQTDGNLQYGNAEDPTMSNDMTTCDNEEVEEEEEEEFYDADDDLKNDWNFGTEDDAMLFIDKPIHVLGYRRIFAISVDSIKNNIFEHENKLKVIEETAGVYVDDIAWPLQATINMLNYQMCYLKALLHNISQVNLDAAENLVHVQDVWSLPPCQRVLLYAYWREALITRWEQKLKQMQQHFMDVADRLKELRAMEDARVLKSAQVIGMTTTGAAKFNDVVRDVGPQIVIVEEAAEVLEAQIITSLTEKCQHLILIGDHQQLRPSTTVYNLAKTYHLDVSLFERMVKNGVHCEKLDVQHRMRPEIASLIVPAIYPRLLNDKSVLHYPPVDGVTKSLFFVTHKEKEEEVADTASKANQYEAEFLLELCHYLLLQGYTGSQITILTTYAGQLFLLRKLRKHYPMCEEVRVTVVDNFQGEENEIILLSLVRSNEADKIGFLKIENRICVALSRARRGMYILGNMDSLESQSEIWKQVKKVLEKQESIGTHLPLYCSIHHVITRVATKSDFTYVPEGGCNAICDAPLSCSHQCTSVCHIRDQEHKLYKCMVPCPKVLCEEDHVCPRRCWEECGPCVRPMHRKLTCGHEHNLPCHVIVDEYKCPTIVQKTHPICGHDVDMPCHQDPATFTCYQPCDVRPPCGHQCKLNCHVTQDPDHLSYKCKEPCTSKSSGCSQNHTCPKRCFEECGKCAVMVEKSLPDCNHKHKMPCHQDPASVECKKKCQRTLPCGHPCRLNCAEKCGNCKVKVDKKVSDCGHTVTVMCCENAERKHCREKCERTMQCGHPCLKRCFEPCGPCKELVPCKRTSPCNHNILVHCHEVQEAHTIPIEILLKKCQYPCSMMLECGHRCNGTCGGCLQGRIHISCSEKCGQVLVCGHGCTVPCAKNCPPCKKKCQYRCQHNKCGKTCGDPCTPCKERCTWSCSHLRCTKKCSEPCNRDACDEPCPKKVKKCQHPCIGFCGEPCPPLCSICDKEKLMEFILFGNEDDEDARFIFLEDCKHVIEVKGLDHWMNMETEEIGMKQCPRCKTLINRCPRYNNKIKQSYKDICQVKQKLFGAFRALEKKQNDLILMINGESLFREFKLLLLKKLQLKSGKANKLKQLNQSELYTLEVKAKLMLEASQIIQASKRSPNIIKHDLVQKLLRHANNLLNSVMHREQLGVQEVGDVTQELTRLQRMQELFRLESMYDIAQVTGKSKSLYEDVSSLLFGIERYEFIRTSAVSKLKELSDSLKSGLAISNEERRMVVAAIGLSKGHWYKCPNGHVYAIGECGGAVETARCNECNAIIGGTQYHLIDTNALASEMDGATASAWPGPMH